MVCPYKGLASFDRDDAEYFFGREELVAELVAQLVGARLLAVVGPSGSGKSSVVRAGLLPSLAGGVLPGSQNWAQAVIRPGEHPTSELRRALRRLAPMRGVLVVDQFEELFTACQDERERDEFIGALLRFPRVVLALRADFYGRCAAFADLSRAVGANHVLVGAMSRDELRSAIERPAQRAGLVVEPDLADALLADVEGEPGALPLLSTALLELWSRREGRRLHVAAYARSGGVQGAVARLAEEAYVELDPAQRLEARRLFLRLSDEDSGGAVVRRRIALGDQAPDVIARLTERRLLTVSDGTVEVAHEALLHEWPRLHGWLEEDSQSRRLRRRLAEAARAWAADDRDPGGLYRGAPLAAALEWASQHDAELDAPERAFLDAGRRASGRAARRLRLGFAAMATLLVVAVITGAVALDQRDQAREQADEAAAQRLGAQALVSDELDRSLLLARQGVALEDSPQTRANLFGALLKSPAAIGVLPVGERVAGLALSPDGRTLLIRGLSGRLTVVDARTRRVVARPGTHTGAVVPAPLRFDASGSRVAIGGSRPTLLDTRTWRRVTQVWTPSEALDLQFTDDGKTLFAALWLMTGELAAQRFDARSGEPLLSTPRKLGRGFRRLASVRVTGDGKRVVTGLEDGPTVLRDGRTLRPLQELARSTRHVALAPDDRTLLLGGRSGSVRFLDLATGVTRVAEGRHGGAVVASAFTPDGRTLATAGEDNRILVWDVARGTVRETLAGHTGWITGLVLSPDARTLYSGGFDGKVLIWDLAGDRRLGRPIALAPFRLDDLEEAFEFGTYGSRAMSRDGRSLAVGNDDGTITVVDVRTLRRSTLRAYRGRPVRTLAFMPDGRLLAGDLLGPPLLLDPRSRGPGRQAPRYGVGFSPTFSADGRMMAVSGKDGVRLQRLRDGRPVGPARMYYPYPAGGPSHVVLSPDGRGLSAGTGNGIEIFDVRTRRRRVALQESTAVVGAPAFTPDGRLIIGGSRDGWIRFWSTETGSPVSPKLAAHVGEVLALSVSPNGRTLATGGDDGTVRLFDVATRTPLGVTLPGLSNTLTAPLFTPDGAFLFAVSVGGRAYRWDVRPPSWARHACAVAGRSLTRAEWADVLPGRTYTPACMR